MVTAGVDISFTDNLSVLENEHASHDLILSAIRNCKRFLCLEKAKNEDEACDISSKIERDKLLHFVSLLLRCTNRLIDESQNISDDLFDLLYSVISLVPCGFHITSSTSCLCFVSVQKLLEYEFSKKLNQDESQLCVRLILKLIQFLSSVSDNSLRNLGSEVQYSQIMNSILKCLNLTENSAEHNTLVSLKTEILIVFEKLFASERNDYLKVVLKDKLDVWIEKLIPLMFEEDKNLRTAAVAAIKIFWSYFSISERSRGFTCTPKFQNDLQHSYEMKLLTFLQKGTEEPNWATLWCVLLDVLETQLITSQNIQLINSLLTVETKAFKQSNEARDAAFTCWKYLIGKFCVLNEGVLKKRLHLLLQPLEAGNNAKTDQLACHKCDVWWYFICQTESKNKELTQGIVVPFLNFCFGSSVEISQYNVNAISGRRCRRFDKFRVLSIDALAQILSPVATEKIQIDFKLQRCSTPIIDLSMLTNHTRLLINCAVESIVCIAHGSCPPTYHVNSLVDFIWEALMYQLLVLIRSDDHTNARITETVKDFFRFIQCLVKQCTTTNLANLLLSPVLESIICGKNALPADVLSSSTYQLRLADLLVGTPTSLLIECLLSPIILSLEGHISKFMNYIDILIEYGVLSSDCMNFSFGVVKRLETLEACVSSCSSGPPALCGTWHSLASKLSPMLQKLHQQDCENFERLTTLILNYPIVNSNVCIDGQRKLPSNYQELHQVWKAFLQEVINIDSEESCMENKVCDHICSKILEYLKKHKCMSQPLLYISIFVNHIGTVMPYESINCFLNKSDIGRASRPPVEKPFLQLSSFVEILHQLSTMLFACKERDSQLYYCVVVYIAQCLSNLFGHIQNSFIALALISKLSQLIVFLLKLETPSVTVIDFYENILSMWKQYTSLVNKFWIDMDSNAIEANIFPAVQNALEFGSEHLKLFTRESWGPVLLSFDLTPQVLKDKLGKINCEYDNDSEEELSFSISNTIVSPNTLDVKQADELNVIDNKTLNNEADGEMSSGVNNKSQYIKVLRASNIENKLPMSVESIASSSKFNGLASSTEENVCESVTIISEDSSLEPSGDSSDGKQVPNSTTVDDDDIALDSCKLTVNNVFSGSDNSETCSKLQSKTESEINFGSINIGESLANSCPQSPGLAHVADSCSLQITSDKNTEENKVQENIEAFQFLKPEKQNPCEAEKVSGGIAKKMCLTKHQKEVMKRRREDIPALYSDLSQDTQSSLFSGSEDSQVTMPERMSVTSTRSEDIPQSFSILFKRTIRPNSLDTLIKNNLDDCNKPSAVSSSTCSENELETLDSVNVSTITNSEEGLSNSEECERENVAKIDKNCVDYEMNPNSCLKETLEDQKLNVKLEDKEEEKSDMSESSSPQNRRKTRRPEKKDVVFLRSKRIQSRILTKQNLDPIQQNLAKKLSSNHLLVKQDDISGYSKTVSNTHSVKGIENQKAVKTVCHKSKSTVIPGKKSITVNTDIGDSKSLKLKIQSNCDINMTEAVNSTRHTCDNTTTKSSVHKAVLKPNLLEGDMNSDKINLNESSEKNSDINTTPKIKKVPDRLVVSLKPLPALSENNAPVSQVDSNLENNCNTDKLTRNKRKRPRNLLEIKSRPRRSKSVRKIEGRDSLKEKVISDYFLNQKESNACSKETINNQISDSVDFQGISNRRRKINDNEPYINAKKRKIDHDNLELSSKPSGSSSNIDKNVCVSNDGSLFSCLAENSLNPFTEVSINKEYIKEQVSSTPNHLKVENCSPVSGTECTENLSVMKGGKKDDKSCSGCSVLLKSIRDPNSQSSGSILQQYGSIGVSCPANEGNVISNLSESECGQHLNASNTSFPSTVSNHIDSEVPEKVCSQSVQILTLPTDESLYPSDSLDVIESSQDSSFCSMPLHVNKFSAIKSNTANSLSVNKQECELNSCVSLSSPKSLKSKFEIENSLPVTHTVQTDAVANFERKDASSESVSDPETLVYGEEKPNTVSVLTEEPQINQSINVADQSTSKRKRKKEPIERLMKNLEIDFKSSFVPSGSRQPNTLEKKRNSLSITNNDTKSSAKRRHSTSSDNRRNKRRGERNVEQLKQETQSLPENLKDRNFSSDSTISSMERLEADRDCQVTNKEEADNNSQSNLTYIDKATCTDSEDLRIRIIFAVGEDKVCHKMDKSDGDKPRILPIMENISIPCNVTDSKLDNPLILDNIQDVKERNECSEEIRITDGCHASNDITKTLDKNVNNSKNPAVDVNKSVDKVQVLVHRKMDNVGLNTLHNECTEPLRALDLISINSFNTNVGKSSINFSELKENSFPSSDNGMTVSHGSDQFTSRPKLTLHMRKKRHNIMSPSAGDTKSKFKNQSSPAKMKNAESKILSSGMTGRAAHLLGLAVSEVAFEERNQPSTSQTKDKKEFRHFKEFQMNKREDFSADKIYITSSDGNVSTSLWVKHEYKSKACPAATILKSSKVPVIQQHHEVPCMDVSPGKVRKRVSFFDPVVSHKLLFRTDAPSIVHTFDHPILEESNDLYGTSNESVQECAHDELQVNITPVSSCQNDAILDSQSAIWPTLTECENPVDVIISDITTPFWTESTIAAFKERGIITVGDLCKLNEKSFMKLQISSPTLEAVKLAIKRYEEKLLNSMDTSEPSIDENPEHESVTIEEISDETSDCINETEDECCVELYEETIQLNKASEYDTSDLIKVSDNFEDSLSLNECIDLIARKYSARQIYSALENKGIFKPNVCTDVETQVSNCMCDQETQVSNCMCDQETLNAIKTLVRRLNL